MRVLLQRVSKAKVHIDNKVHSQIGIGLLVFIGIEENDNSEDREWLIGKINKMRLFNDLNGVMNLSVQDVGGEILVISQFTLHALIKKGNRPSYMRAAAPDIAQPFYNKFIEELKSSSQLEIKSGVFGADMKVELINDGPVTIWLDTKNKE